MVWHAHMLNPRAFLEDSIRHAKMNLWTTGFPWEIINACIDDRTLDYNPSDFTKELFEQLTGFRWDNLHDSPYHWLSCPACTRPMSVPWTAPAGDTLDTSHGFADRNFRSSCPGCGTTINHERLQVARFKDDIAELRTRNMPMPGTLFSKRGIPEGSYHAPRRYTFPNRFLLVPHTLSLSDEALDGSQTVNDLDQQLGVWVRDTKKIYWRAKHLGWRWSIPRHEEMMAVHRMMSRYRDNSSPFALDLVGAVLRQGAFVQKMDDIDWLHSPTVMQTMAQLIEKYTVFMSIMASYRLGTAVPTLDVDLAWHTHQLSPSRYYSYCVHATGLRSSKPTFIDHNDNLSESDLVYGFEWTCLMYETLTKGRPYAECTCWYCEAIRVQLLPSVPSDPSFLTALRLQCSYDTACRRARRRNSSSPLEVPQVAPYICAPRIVRDVQEDPSHGAGDDCDQGIFSAFWRELGRALRRKFTLSGSGSLLRSSCGGGGGGGCAGCGDSGGGGGGCGGG